MSDPRVVTNPPGQSAIADRVDDFTGFRRALLTPLPGEQALTGWRPAAGDLGLQVLEWWAYLGDVLTFYNERIANSAYLRTATTAQQLADLAALIGYRPAPGVAATGQLALLRTLAHPKEPLTVPAGLQLSSTATPAVPAQTFEVTGDWEFSGPSNVPVALAPDDDLVLNASGGPASVLLAGQVRGVKTGDQLLLVASGWNGSSDSDWAWVQVAAVSPAPDPGTGRLNTLVSFTSAACFGPPPVIDWLRLLVDTERFEIDDAFGDRGAFGVGGRFGIGRAFGNLGGDITGRPLADYRVRRPTGVYWRPEPTPAPVTPLPAAPAFQLLRPTRTGSLWNQGDPGSAVVDDSTTPLTVHLNAVVRAFAGGELVLFDGGSSGVALGSVASVAEQLWTLPYPPAAAADITPAPTAGSPAPVIVVAHSVLGVTTPDPGILTGYYDPTTVTVRSGFRPVGTIIGTPLPALGSLPVSVSVPSGWSPAAGAATAILQDATGAGVQVSVTAAGTASVALNPSGATPEQLAPPLAVPLQLLLDLVPVTRGATVASETLGSGNSALAGQSFTLKRSPLTYVPAGSGIQSTLTVYVGGIAWSEVRSLFDQDPAARVYTVTVAADGSATVGFGDGVNGARLPTGSGNVTARYRYGSGQASPPAGRLTTIVRPQPNLASVANPIAVDVGADPQTPAGIRHDAPAAVATFGRAISGSDYGVIAGQAPGVTRVGVIWSFDGERQRTAVTVYVGGGGGAVTAAQSALAGAEDPNRPVTVVAATELDVTVAAGLQIVPGRIGDAVVAAASASLTALFEPASLAIGQSLYRSQIEAALSVDGVAAVTGLEVATAGATLDQVLSPGAGAYFALAASPSLQAVPGD